MDSEKNVSCLYLLLIVQYAHKGSMKISRFPKRVYKKNFIIEVVYVSQID
jgi:hypothetical protein